VRLPSEGNDPEAIMTKYYVFKGTTGTGQAITDDKLGTKLPQRQFGEWVFSRELELKPGENRIGAGSDEIINAVAKHGFYHWPSKD
jgi:hypothetical protein